MMATDEQRELKPPQTARRKKIVKRWERQYGLTLAQIKAADKVRAELVANPLMTFVPWNEALGSNEWKMQTWRSVSTGEISCVEIVIGEAVPE